MEEYAKAKAKQLADNAKFLEAAKILGFECNYFAGMYTCKDKGKFIGRHSAEEWLDIFNEAVDQIKR